MTSTMISVNIDRSEPLDLHDQVAAETVGRSGRRSRTGGSAPLGKGHGSSAGREQEHGAASDAHSSWRRACRVPSRSRHHRDRHAQQSAVLEQVRALVEFARHQGYRRGEIIKMIETMP